jgi:hypothetical protein
MDTSDRGAQVSGNGSEARQVRPEPSRRNREIYEQVCLLGRTQAAVAAEWGISQRRVGQICEQVESWHNYGTAMIAGDHRSHLRDRLELLLKRSLRMSSRSLELLEQDGQPAHGRAGLSALRVALRAARLIAQLDRRRGTAGVLALLSGEALEQVQKGFRTSIQKAKDHSRTADSPGVPPGAIETTRAAAEVYGESRGAASPAAGKANGVSKNFAR